MKSVKINTKKLLEVIKANRETHIKEYDTAVVEYRKDAIAELAANLKQAKSGGEIIHHISIVQPQNYSETYNTAIRMLELSEDEVTELSMSEFQQYVEDNWHWKGAFLASTSMYNAKAAK